MNHYGTVVDGTDICLTRLHQERGVELRSASEQLRMCQESLREYQAKSACASATRAVTETALQQALAAAEAAFRASTQVRL